MCLLKILLYLIGGTGCVWDLVQAQSQLQDQVNKGLCGCTGRGNFYFPGCCLFYSKLIYFKFSNRKFFPDDCSWKGQTGTALLQLATAPNTIGQASTGKKCRVTGGCSTCACPHYVQYSIDNGATWLGYTFEGTPGKLNNIVASNKYIYKFVYISNTLIYVKKQSLCTSQTH